MLFSALLGCQPKPSNNSVNFTGDTMGTQWSVTLGLENDGLASLQEGEGDAYQAILFTITAELERINALMSTWDPNSELSLFNVNQSVEPITLHADTLAVIRTALEVSKTTNGAYDVTRGNVFALWGFSRDEPLPDAPSREDLNSALASSGWQALTLSNQTAQKKYPAMTVDLSSVAKGFAVDRIGEILEAQALSHYLVNIGGEIRSRGRASAEQLWRIGVEAPNTDLAAGIEVSDAHLASSGSYRNVRIINGRQVSHLIHGQTGQPVTDGLVAVTVLHDSTALADAWATAFMVVGAKEAKKRALSDDLAVQLTLLAPSEGEAETASEFTLWQSPRWQALDQVTLK